MNRTKFLQLPLFEATDKPSILQDWNDTVQKIDTAYANINPGSVPEIAEELEHLENLIYDITNQYDSGVLDIAVGQVSSILSAIAPTFNADTRYYVGDLVWHYNSDDINQAHPILYQFVQDHTAGDPWNNNEVVQTDLSEILSQAHTSIVSLDARVTALENAPSQAGVSPDVIADTFDASHSYSVGDLVYGASPLVAGKLYKCIIAWPSILAVDECFSITSVEDEIKPRAIFVPENNNNITVTLPTSGPNIEVTLGDSGFYYSINFSGHAFFNAPTTADLPVLTRYLLQLPTDDTYTSNRNSQQNVYFNTSYRVNNITRLIMSAIFPINAYLPAGYKFKISLASAMYINPSDGKLITCGNLDSYQNVGVFATGKFS